MLRHGEQGQESLCYGMGKRDEAKLYLVLANRYSSFRTILHVKPNMINRIVLLHTIIKGDHLTAWDR